MSAPTSAFDLAAVDMDGTLLHDDKTLDSAAPSALAEAVGAGRTVALCTGRCVSEIRPYLPQLPMVRYAIAEVGALLYDLREKRVVARHALPREVIDAVVSFVCSEDVMVQGVSTGQAYATASMVPRMAAYNMAPYIPLYEQTATLVPRMTDLLEDPTRTWEKLNLFHRSTQARERTRERLGGLPAVESYSEVTSLEVTPLGIDKGSGIRALCELLGIDASRALAIGDSDNDLAAFRDAGMGVAVANASERALGAADALVSAHGKGGVAEAVRRYLM